MLFTDVPFLERFARAAQAGFKGVEFLFPYEWEAETLKRELDRNHLTQVLHNCPAGDWAAGDRGIACDPHRIAEFEAGIERAIAYAQVLDCRQLNCLAGVPPADTSMRMAHDTLVRNLRYAAARLRDVDLRLLVEAINTRDIPGFFVNNTRQARDIIAEVGLQNVFLQYDAYHMQIMEGDLTRTLTDNIDCIAHIQVADPPLRSEPGTGEINFTHLLAHVDRLGYAGWIGCEYRPTGLTEEGLTWAAPYLDTGEGGDRTRATGIKA
jgi:hydroxypyruvate isomerase